MSSSRRVSLYIETLLVACAVGCAGSDEPGVDVGVPDAPVVPESATCVWNQAYQENTVPDVVADILAGARGCYVLIDPYDSEAARDAVAELKDAGNLVGCYISVGTCEEWRDDYDDLRDAGACTDVEWPEWPGEFFVRDASAALPLMLARVETLAGWGCDYVEFDNMDWAEDPDPAYQIAVSPGEAQDYYNGICDRVRGEGMRCMAKSSLAGAIGFDGLTVESQPRDLDWWETADLVGMLEAGGLGIVIHYGESDCVGRAAEYRAIYGDLLSFLCENPASGGYLH